MPQLTFIDIEQLLFPPRQLSSVFSPASQGASNAKVLLSGVSGEVNSGQVLAILGPSGAGKTTLLHRLGGRVHGGKRIKSSGSVLLDGTPRDAKLWKRQVAFTEQSDLLYSRLTVWETISNAARLRILQVPDGRRSSEEKAYKLGVAEDVLRALRLTHARDTLVGDEDVRGLSGGEKRRVSLGIEMVTNPRVVFLDEPTSGLDSNSALHLVRVMKESLVAQDACAVMTIHQPTAEVVRLLDLCVLLAPGGKQVYFGTFDDAYDHFARLGHPCPQHKNISEHLLDLVTLDVSSPELRVASEERITELVRACPRLERTGTATQADEDKPARLPAVRPVTRAWAMNGFSELTLLLKRYLVQAARDRSRWVAQFSRTILTSLIFGWLFYRLDTSQQSIQNRLGMLFMLVALTLFDTAMPLMSFSLERTIIKRERASRMYRASTIYIAKAVTETLYALPFNLLLNTVVYWFTGLSATPAQFFIFLLFQAVLTVAAVGTGLCISSTFAVQQAEMIVPAVLLLYVLFVGLFLNINSIPKPLIFIYWCSPATHAYQSLVINEFQSLTFTCPDNSTGACFTQGEQVVAQYGMLNGWSVWDHFGLLVAITFCLHVLAFVSLKLTTKARMTLV